jgi:hypothetical protein
MFRSWRFAMTTIDFFPPATEYDLADALCRFGDPEITAWFDQHPRSQDDAVIEKLRREKEGRWIRSIRRDIRNGSLVATAFQEPITISSSRQRISPDVWDILQFDVVYGSARADPLRLSDIKIQENVWASRIHGLLYGSQKNDTGSRYVEAENEDQAADEPAISDVPRHEKAELIERYGALVLKIGEDEMPFRGAKQKAIVSQLVEASLKSDRVRSDDLLGAAESGVDSVPKAFRGYAMWATFLKYYRSEHGWCWLDLSGGAGT